MARKEPGHEWFIAAEIVKQINAKKERMGRRREPFTGFIHWVLDMYSKDQLEEAHVLRAKLEAEMRPQIEAKVRSELEKSLVRAAGAEKEENKSAKQKHAS